MSEQTSAETATETAQPDKQEPDDSEPSPERQAELRNVYEANIAVGKPPYSGLLIATRGELKWIIRERGWKTVDYADTSSDLPNLRETGIQADLSDIEISFANLSGVRIDMANFSSAELTGVDLSGALIVTANFSGANMNAANLSGAFVGEGDFSGADLTAANLSGANITGNFSGADLSAANLSGTVITESNFSGTDLTRVRMDAATVLGSSNTDVVNLDGKTRLLDVSWNGAILALVNWDNLSRLGDEAAIKNAPTRKKRVVAYVDAARAYRGLAKALQAQGLTIPALKYRRREQQLERRALLYSFALGPWIFSWLLNIVSGYGDKPARALACYLAVVGTCAGAYWAITNQVFSFITSNSAHLAWYEALVLSISSFHGRGFFPSIPSLGDPIAIVAAAEAIIGLFIELVFIATFTQRFFAR